MTNAQLIKPEADYAAAVWAWLRGEIIMEPAGLGLDASVADAIKRQCQNEHKFKP